MKIFVCYARVDRPFCTEFVQKIDNHDIWFDERLKAGQDWWKIIQQRLDWCECFIYLLSPSSVESPYCRREVEIALKLNKIVVPIIIDEHTTVPTHIKHIQYARVLNVDNIEEILNALYEAEKTLEKAVVGHKRIQDIPKVERPHPVAEENETIIGQAAQAMESHEFDRAVFLIQTAIERGVRYEFVNLNSLLKQAEQMLDSQVKDREREREYRTIYELAQHSITRLQACQAFQNFRKLYDDYDPQNIGDICAGNRPSFPAPKVVQTVVLPSTEPMKKVTDLLKPLPAAKPSFTMPLLEFAPIFTPTGTQAYEMARYPITNQQFELFLSDPRGAKNPKWWQFSSYAKNWHEKNPTISSPTWSGDLRPRDSVCWYDAMAYCYWLSDKLERRITLPNQLQWRRAAQGTDKRLYPWGNEFNPEFCNSRESNIRMTTVVNRYPQGVSPYGVVDMAGNIWEWCLDAVHPNPYDVTVNANRVMMGGCHRSERNHVQTTFEFAFDPSYVYRTIGFRVIALL